jgi:YVTN family beta-propeller protein
VFALLISFDASAAPVMYVSTGDEVAVIDLMSGKVTGRIPELENAHGLAGSQNSEYLVAGSMKPADPNAQSATIKPEAVSDAEHAAHHAPDTTNKPVSLTSYVSIVHPGHGHVMRRIAVRGLTHHTAVSPDGKYAVAVHPDTGGISVIELERMMVIKELPTGKSANYGIFSRDGRHLYVSNAHSGTVSEIETNGWTVKRTFPVEKEPEHLALSPNGGYLFLATVGDGRVAMVDIKSGAVTKRFAIGKQPHGVAVSGDGKRLFASSQEEGKLVGIDLIDGKQHAIELQPAPYHIEYVGSVNRLYISSRKLPKIWVIDPHSLNITGEIDIGSGTAHQMVVLDR